MPRPRPTFADFLAVAIGPILIGCMVASLVFFLIEVFYQGGHNTRLQYIMGMFVMGAVGVSRISIEEGREYSFLYAVPLAIVTAIAAFRFVEFRGALSAISPLISLGLIGLIWWCADRLTWDCTVIDERESGPGEGLLQTVGLDGATDSGEADGEQISADTELSSRGLWQRFLEYRRRPHAPGVWVLYFSLAALPIFGIGQAFLRSDALESRRFVFHLLVIYVATGLGLLMATSFLGLRRHLRGRRLEMPTEMAQAWAGAGTVMIAAVLLLCLALPRTNPEYSISHLSFLATSPDNLSTSDWAFGNDSPEDAEPSESSRLSETGEQSADSSGPGDAQSGAPPQDGEPNSQASGAESSQSPSSSSESTSAEQGPAAQDQASSPSSDRPPSNTSGDNSPPNSPSADDPSTQGKLPSGSSSSDSSPDSAAQSDSAEAGESQQGTPSGQDSGTPQQEPGNDRTPSPDAAGSSESDPSQPSSQAGDESEAGQQTEPSEEEPGTRSDRGGSESQDRRSPSTQQPAEEPEESDDEAGDGAASETSSDSRSSSNRSPSGGNSPAAQFSPAAAVSGLFSQLGSVLSLLYWIAIGGIVGYLLWRHRSAVARAVRDFVDALRSFWSRLFDRGTDAVAEPLEAAAAGPPAKRFADFPDPFASGAAERASIDELIDYSFQAFEAWGQDHGCPRGPEQTPHEFARAAARHSRLVANEALRLAELYSWSAYARESVSAKSVEHLRRLWNQLNQTRK